MDNNHVMKQTLLAFLVVTVAGPLLGQQDAQYTQWALDKLNLNPAYAGVKGRPTASGVFRTQWIGFEGAPVSQAARFHAPLNYEKAGIGVTLENDVIGAMRSTQVKGAYAYHVKLDRRTRLSLGLEASLRQVRIDYTDARVNELDPLVGENAVSNRLLPDVGAGAYLYSERFYLGASVTRIGKGTLYAPEGLPSGRAFANVVPHFYAMAGGDFPVATDVSLRPGVLVKHVRNAPTSVDLNALLMYRDIAGGGLSVRAGESPGSFRPSAVALVGQVAILEDGIMGLSYDLEVSKVNTGTIGGFELLYEHIWGRRRRPGIPCYWH